MVANGTAHNSRLRGDLCAPSIKAIRETCRVSSRTRPVTPIPPVIPEAAAQRRLSGTLRLTQEPCSKIPALRMRMLRMRASAGMTGVGRARVSVAD